MSLYTLYNSYSKNSLNWSQNINKNGIWAATAARETICVTRYILVKCSHSQLWLLRLVWHLKKVLLFTVKLLWANCTVPCDKQSHSRQNLVLGSFERWQSLVRKSKNWIFILCLVNLDTIWNKKALFRLFGVDRQLSQPVSFETCFLFFLSSSGSYKRLFCQSQWLNHIFDKL